MQRSTTGFLGFFLLSIGLYAQTPTISAVKGAADYSTSIAQGSVFIVQGTGLSASGLVQAPGLPLATTIPGSNVKITFTPVAGGAGVDAYMVYLFNANGVNQLAAILPSTVAPGNYNVTVTNGTAVSAPFRATVVARHFAVITADSSGSGAAVIQNFVSATQLDVNRLTTGSVAGFTISPAKPGQTLILYGTGMGPITTPDNVAPGAIDLRGQVPVQVIVGGQSITPTYAGRSPALPGTDQINFVLPADVATGCVVSLQVSVAGQLSNPTALSIAPPGASACVSPYYGTDVLTRLDQGGTIVAGNFGLLSFATKQSLAGFNVTAQVEQSNGTFSQYSGAQLGSATAFLNPTGNCQVFHRLGTQTDVVFGGSRTNLDAGKGLTLNGPNVTNMAYTQNDDNSYSLDLGIAISGLPVPVPGINANPLIAPGTYTVRGTGGKDIGPFTASVTVGTPIKPVDLPATVARGQGLTLTWTGGGATDLVNVLGVSGTTIGGTAQSPLYDTGVFICSTTANRGTITVPASVLGQLPATPADGSGLGILAILSNTVPTTGNGLFSAPLTAGGTTASGAFVGETGLLTTSVLFQ